MSRFWNEPVRVEEDEDGLPHCLHWRLRSLLIVRVEECWNYTGRWWATPQLRGRSRRYFRAYCTKQGGEDLCLELFVEKSVEGRNWFLSRVLD